MKIECNHIYFKSIPEFYDKEKSGRKPNTIRYPGSALEKTQFEQFEKYFGNTLYAFITITNTLNPEFTFSRTLTDIFHYKSMWVFSWKP